MRNLLLVICIACSLQSCIFVAGAAAGAAAVAVVYDHRKLEKILLDNTIAKDAIAKVKATPSLQENCHIEITCFNQAILLTGEAAMPEQRQTAENLIRAIPDVTHVYNQITVQRPASSLAQASDSWITTKIKTQLLATKGLQSGTIKVVTEKGTVYLMGIVTPEQADIAVSISRQVAGVQRVIKIFQYTSEVPVANTPTADAVS
jgi:osmotically-inducible protein OsmY